MGFENKFSKEDFLLAVKRGKTLSDSKIAERLGVTRSTVWRYKQKNPKIVKEAEQILESANYQYVSKTKLSAQEFIDAYPLVQEWVEMQEKNQVLKSTWLPRIRALRNVCHHLKTTPEGLTLERASDLCYEIKQLDDSEDAPKGLAFYYIRGGIRSWFQLMHGISAQMLSSKGIDAKASKGTGTMSRERITKEQRARFDEVVGQAVRVALKENPMKDWGAVEINYATRELQGMAHFMYYTANRITSTHNIKLNDPQHVLAGRIWEIHTLDKGKRGGIHWQKPLTGDGKHKLETYISTRFNIEKDEIPIKARNLDSLLFPTLSETRKAQEFETVAMKIAHQLTGAKVTMQNHAWRHTFAQDWLHASDWNYEMGAEIGGWSSTETMKKCYGKISKDAISRGLRRAMGEVVEDVTYELLW